MWERKLYKALLSSLKFPNSRVQMLYGEHTWKPRGETAGLGLQPIILLFQFHPNQYRDLEATQECVLLARICLV